MRFLADECCDTELVSLMRSEGHDVVYISEFKPGASDSEILRLAAEEKRILVTEDKDFGELVYRLRKPAYGILLLRFGVGERTSKWKRLKELLAKHSARLHSSFVTVEDEKFRFRPLSGNEDL